MPVQFFAFIFYLVLSVVIFPFTVLSFLIVRTNVLPNLKSFIVTTNSMEPSVPKNSIIYTLAEPKYKAGDAIAFQENGNVMHRIIKEEILGETTYYSTKGDANSEKDFSLIPSEEVYGKVIGVVPFNLILAGTVLPTLFLIYFQRKRSLRF